MEESERDRLGEMLKFRSFGDRSFGDIHEKYSSRKNGDLPFAPGIGSVTQSFGLIGNPCLPCFLISFVSTQERDQTSICGIGPGKVLAEDRVWIIPPASKQNKGRIGNRGSLAQSRRWRGPAGSSAARVFMSPTPPLRRLFPSPGRVPGAARTVCRPAQARDGQQGQPQTCRTNRRKMLHRSTPSAKMVSFSKKSGTAFLRPRPVSCGAGRKSGSKEIRYSSSFTYM